MMKDWKKKTVRHLREYDALCRAKENLLAELEWRPDSPGLQERLAKVSGRIRQTDRALAILTPENRLVLQLLDISRVKCNGARVCELLGCEISTVYRRRDKALRQFAQALGK